MKRRSRAGGETIKGRRRAAAKPKRRDAPKAVARSNSSTAGKETEVARLTRQLNEAREREAATSEVLQIISGSPGDLQRVFASMLENAVRICDATFGNVYRWDGDALTLVATHNTPRAFAEARRFSPFNRLNPKTVTGRMLATKGVVHVTDAAAQEGYADRSDPAAVTAVELGGVRTFLAVPMLKENELIGTFTVYRQEVRPFTEKQIALGQNFAAQAVIAIENARLLNELRQRTTDLTERTADLTEALEQQTARSEVLQVISSSPGDLQPVFATMLEQAVRICNAVFGNIYRWDGAVLNLIASHNMTAFARYRGPSAISAGTGVLGRMLNTNAVVHVADLAADPAYAERNPLTVTAVEIGGRADDPRRPHAQRE